jgi:hypothetical protein
MQRLIVRQKKLSDGDSLKPQNLVSKGNGFGSRPSRKGQTSNAKMRDGGGKKLLNVPNEKHKSRNKNG